MAEQLPLGLCLSFRTLTTAFLEAEGVTVIMQNASRAGYKPESRTKVELDKSEAGSSGTHSPELDGWSLEVPKYSPVCYFQ